MFGAYLIAHGFFSVYNMGVDTLFLCFCECLSPQYHYSWSCCKCTAYFTVITSCFCGAVEDLERNDGSAEKPYFMSKNLMKILNKKNKQPKRGWWWWWWGFLPSNSQAPSLSRSQRIHVQTLLNIIPSFIFFLDMLPRLDHLQVHLTDFTENVPVNLWEFFSWHNFVTKLEDRSVHLNDVCEPKHLLLAFINIIWFVFLLRYAQWNYIAHIIDCFWCRLIT